jgi:hypothetical protein
MFNAMKSPDFSTIVPRNGGFCMELDLTRAAIGAVVGGGAFTFFSMYMGRATSRIPPKASGVIAPSRWYIAVTSSVMTALGIFLIGPWHLQSDLVFWLGVICCALGATSLLGLTRAHDVVWNEHGVWGPAGWWSLSLGRKKRFIAWDEVTQIKADLTGNQCLISARSRPIRWNITYKNHRVLMSSVKLYRPDLFLTGQGWQ